MWWYHLSVATATVTTTTVATTAFTKENTTLSVLSATTTVIVHIHHGAAGELVSGRREFQRSHQPSPELRRRVDATFGWLV